MKDSENELNLENPDGTIYTFLTADGVESKNRFRNSETIIMDNVEPKNEDILIAEANYGLIGVLLGDKNRGKTVLAETSDRAAKLCELNLKRNNVERCKEESFLLGTGFRI